MKAMLYMDNNEQPVSVLDEVEVVEMGSTNHGAQSHYRIFYKTHSLNTGKTLVDMHREQRLTVKLDDGRTGNALLQHVSMDAEGNAVGVLRVLGELNG